MAPSSSSRRRQVLPPFLLLLLISINPIGAFGPPLRLRERPQPRCPSRLAATATTTTTTTTTTIGMGSSPRPAVDPKTLSVPVLKQRIMQLAACMDRCVVCVCVCVCVCVSVCMCTYAHTKGLKTLEEAELHQPNRSDPDMAHTSKPYHVPIKSIDPDMT
jgi:hypothetical protein